MIALDQLKEIMGAVIEDDEIFALAAKAYRKALDALVQEGFSHKEAMDIIIHQGCGVGGK